jgi:hypothetical protein
VRATGNHPFMVRVPGNSAGGNATRHPTYEWRHVEHLRPGDCVIQAMAYPDQGGDRTPDGQEATPELLQFLGAILGDGTVSPGVGVRMAMPPNDRCVKEYREFAAALFTKLAKNAGGSAARHEVLPRAPVVLQQRGRDFGFSSAQASRMLAAWGFGGRAHTKRVPAWVYGLRRDLRMALLAGIVDTDGSVDKRGVLAIGFCNRALTEDVRDLATGCGLACSSVLHSTYAADVLPQPGRRERYDAWRFVISSARDVAAIPFVDPLYRERVNANPQRHRPRGKDAAKAGLSPDLGFFLVKSITPVGVQTVYDLTVEDGHSFFCEHVLVSNTYSNFGEAREMFTEQNILPLYVADAAVINRYLKPDFTSDRRLAVQFDLTQLRALQEDMDKQYARLTAAVAARWVAPNEARAQVGLPPIDGGDAIQPAAAPAASDTGNQDQGNDGTQNGTTGRGRLRLVGGGGGSKASAIQPQLTPRDFPELFDALRALAEPALTDELDAYLDGQRRRLKARLLADATDSGTADPDTARAALPRAAAGKAG